VIREVILTRRFSGDLIQSGSFLARALNVPNPYPRIGMKIRFDFPIRRPSHPSTFLIPFVMTRAVSWHPRRPARSVNRLTNKCGRCRSMPLMSLTTRIRQSFYGDRVAVVSELHPSEPRTSHAVPPRYRNHRPGGREWMIFLILRGSRPFDGRWWNGVPEYVMTRKSDRSAQTAKSRRR